MEATHLVAWLAGKDEHTLTEALEILSSAPRYDDEWWLDKAFAVIDRFPAPHFERNYKLGLIFEWKVGEGRLLVCMSPLDLIRDHPEAAQLYQSILNYMNSPAFKPEHQISESELTDL